MTAVACAAALSMVAGCSEDGDEPPEPPDRGGGGLLRALGKARDTAESRTFIEYGDLERVRQLTGGDRERFRQLQGYGFGTIAPNAKLIDNALAFDPLAFDTGLMVGRPPKWGGVLWGSYDLDAVNDRLAEREVPRQDAGGGATVWTSAEDYSSDVGRGPLADAVQLGEFNSLRTQRDAVFYGPAGETVAWLAEPGEPTLAGDEDLASLADCLGDVVIATITTPRQNATTFAVGVRVDDAGEVTEVACVTAEGNTERLRDRVAGELEDGRSKTGQPWSEALPNGEVEVTGELVRITSRPGADEPVGRMPRLLANGDLEALAG